MGTRRDRGSRPYSSVTLVTLPHVTDAATMRKISIWRYSAVNRKTLFAALACALLVLSLLGCNALQTTNKLQTIQITPSSSDKNGFNLFGKGATVQLVA